MYLYDPTLCYLAGYVHRVLLDLTGEDLIRAVVLQTHEGDPVLVSVLEADDVCGYRFGTLEVRWAFVTFFALFFLCVEQHALAAAVTVDRDTLATALPCRAVDVGNEILGHAVGKVYRHRDRVVDPLLYGSLHAHLGNPVDVVCRSAVVWRGLEPAVELLVRDGLELRGVVSVYLEPLYKLVVVDVVLLELLAHVVDEVGLLALVRGVDLAAALVDGTEYGLDAGCGLRHERRRTRGGYCEQGDIAASVLDHAGIEFGVGLAYAADHGVVLLACGVVDGECSALLGHGDR